MIANTIGASRETVTRLLRQFQERCADPRAGIVRLDPRRAAPHDSLRDSQADLRDRRPGEGDRRRSRKPTAGKASPGRTAIKGRAAAGSEGSLDASQLHHPPPAGGAPFFLLSIAEGRFGIALGLFVAAGISDGVDGYLARRFKMNSALGAYLDPIADKLLLMSSYLFLAIPSYPAAVKIPVWLAVLVISRDILLLLVALLLILARPRNGSRRAGSGRSRR